MANTKKVICEICGKEITKNNIEKHLQSHENTDSKAYHYHVTHEGLNCQFCGKLCKNKNSLAQHELRCKMNLNRYINENYVNGMLGKTSSTKGLSAENCESIRRQKETYQKNKELRLHKDTSGVNNSMSKHPEAKEKISKTCLEKSRNGTWHKSLAKNNHYVYKGVDLDCKWEFEFAKWLDSKNIRWIRPKDRFKYIYQNKERYYTPDFYLLDFNEFVEVKGYTTGKDYAKWNQFPKNLKLTILKKKDLINLGVNIT